MRKLTWAVVILAVLWAGYWGAGWFAVRKGVTAFIDGLRVHEVTATYGELSVAGFPNRFDVTLTDPAYADPVAGVGWRGPFLQLMALSYQPQHYIAILPQSHVLTVDRRDLPITSQDMRASLVFVPGPSFVLNRSTLVTKELDIAGWTASEVRIGTRRSDGSDLAHDLGAEALGLAVPGAQAHVDRLYLDATVAFPRRLDRFAFDPLLPPTRIELRELSVTAGPARLVLSGTLTGDAQGRASGEIAVVAEQWPGLLALLVAAGLIPEANRAMTETGLRMLAGGQDRIETTLVYRDGQVLLGALPLGGAPQMSPP